MARKTIILSFAALMVFAFASAAFAGCGNWGGPQGPGACWNGSYMQGQGPAPAPLTQEQVKTLNSLRQAHFTKLGPLFKEMKIKGYQLESLMVDAAANASKIKKLAKELGSIQGQIFTEKVTYRAALAAAGLPFPPHDFGPRGFHRGGDRHGFGPRPFYGQGPCFDGSCAPQGCWN